MIIDTTYFQQGELYIPNSRSVDAGGVGGVLNTNENKLQSVIDRYERNLIINALGVAYYNELNAILVANTLGDVGNEKWLALVDGEDYSYNGKTFRWDGLRGFNQHSLVASYVFCNYLRENDVTYTTVGTVRGTSKNATSVTATPKYTDIWNRFILAYQGRRFANEIQPKIITNPSGEVGVSYFREEGLIRSLYQYLTDKNVLDDTLFPDFEFTFYEIKNSMGI